MDDLNGVWSRPTVRVFGSAILLFLYYHQILQGTHGTAIVCALVLLLYLLLIWEPLPLRNNVTYIVAWLFIMAAVVVLRWAYDISDAKLLWPLFCILATLPRPYQRLAIILAIPTAAGILVLSYTYPFPFATLFGLFGIFTGVRARRIRGEAYQMSQLHLQELNEAHEALKQAHAELQEATVHSIRYAALEERTRLAREIHDGLGHQLTGLIVQLEALKVMLVSDPARALASVSKLLDIARQAMSEVRTAVREWASDEMGLGPVALRGLVSQVQARSGVDIHYVEEGDISEWPMATSITLYRVLQESLTNVLRHANATAVTVEVKEDVDDIRLTISDNGLYTEAMPLSPGFGLKGMIERCRQLGGSCNFAGADPHGLRTKVVLPRNRLEEQP